MLNTPMKHGTRIFTQAHYVKDMGERMQLDD